MIGKGKLLKLPGREFDGGGASVAFRRTGYLTPSHWQGKPVRSADRHKVPVYWTYGAWMSAFDFSQIPFTPDPDATGLIVPDPSLFCRLPARPWGSPGTLLRSPKAVVCSFWADEDLGAPGNDGLSYARLRTNLDGMAGALDDQGIAVFALDFAFTGVGPLSTGLYWDHSTTFTVDSGGATDDYLTTDADKWEGGQVLYVSEFFTEQGHGFWDDLSVIHPPLAFNQPVISHDETQWRNGFPRHERTQIKVFSFGSAAVDPVTAATLNGGVAVIAGDLNGLADLGVSHTLLPKDTPANRRAFVDTIPALIADFFGL